MLYIWSYRNRFMNHKVNISNIIGCFGEEETGERLLELSKRKLGELKSMETENFYLGF